MQQIRSQLNKYMTVLERPGDWFNSQSSTIIFPHRCIFSGLFLILGALLNHCWAFPLFYFFAPCFLLIGILSFGSVYHYNKMMRKITAEIAMQPAARKATHFYFSFCTESSLYIVLPVLIILIFGIGGCSMFEAIQLTPTLVWILFLFFIVVYISIIGYLQYIVLAIYIRNLACGSDDYHHLEKSLVDCIPAQLEWIQNLTKLSHIYRSSFFSLGSAFIVAYSVFCWVPNMQANTSVPAFFLLWGIIFIMIVLMFPVVSLLEYQWIKKIVGHLKAAYINDLTAENQLVNCRETEPVISNTHFLLQRQCAIQILLSNDYPLKSAWASCYAVILSAFNFAAAVATVMQQLSTFSNVFLHIA